MTTDQRREIKVDGDLNPHFNQQEVRFNSTQRLKPRPKQKGVNVKFIAIGMMVVGLVGFGVLTAVQYFAPDAGQVAEVPVIKSDEKPDRIVPDEKGGVEIPHRDKAIFTRLKPGAGVNVEEVIIQEPEKPIVQKRDAAIPSEPTEAEKLSGPSDDKAPDMLQVEHKDKPGISSSSAVVAEKVTSTPFDLNKAIMNSEETQQKILDEDDDEVHEPVLKSVESTPYQNLADEQPPKQVASSEPIVVSDPISEDVLAKTSGRQRPDIEVIEKKGSLKNEPVSNEKVAMAAPKVDKAAPAPQAKASDAQFRVQLGSMKTREASKEEWARLQKMNPELRALELFVDEVNIPEKGTFYRIQGGRVTREEAASLCSTLKKKNTACFVVKG